MNPTIIRRLVAVILLAAAAQPALATDGALVPHAADYKVRISFLGGTLTTRVYDVGNGFMARSVITPTGFASVLMNGSIVEQSEFGVSPDGVRPRHYESIDTLSKEHKTMNFDFDWESRAVTGDINDEDFVFDFDDAVHDRVSIQYELMLNLMNGEEPRQYSLLDGDELKQLTVTNIGTKRVDVPYGEFDAIGIQHRADNSSRVSTLWCVRELGYLPVIIEQHRKGKLRVRAELTDYRPMQETAATVAGGTATRD